MLHCLVQCVVHSEYLFKIDGMIMRWVCAPQLNYQRRKGPLYGTQGLQNVLEFSILVSIDEFGGLAVPGFGCGDEYRSEERRVGKEC